MQRALKTPISIVILCLVLTLPGCAKVPFESPQPKPVQIGLTASQLAAGAWTSQSGVYRLRQTVLFEFRGARVPMAGLLRLDLDERKVRLVAMNDLGVKLFDLAVDEEGEEQHYLLPDLAEIPHLSEAVAASVRRVFLTPHPEGSEEVHFSGTGYQLVRPYHRGAVQFAFGGSEAQLLESQVAMEGEDWRARYFEYQKAGEVSYPRGIVLDDRVAGYRLTLWLEEVTRIDE